MSGPRVGLVGARRARQGLGPYVARDLVRAGACVPCFVGTGEASRDAARRQLAGAGVQANGYLDTETMLAEESLDAVAILSPSHTHAAHLEAALAAGVHVLCEKPLVWGDPDLGRRARRFVRAFDAAGLLLWENCQWPCTLAAYEQLFPGALARPPSRFDMWMQPASTGVQALGDSLPHALSLLQALLPGEGERLEQVRYAGEGGRQTVAFDYCTAGRRVAVEVHLVPSDRSPRRAAYAVDGRRARRRIREEDYRLSFASDDGREVALEDPMTRLLFAFVGALRGGATEAPAPRIAERMELMEALVRAHPETAMRRETA